MEVIYRAFDGTEFREAEPCLRYETNCMPKMFGRDGVTSNVDEALVVYLENDHQAKNFVRKSEKEESAYDGVDEWSTGLFVWDGCAEQYFELDDISFDALRHFMNFKI